MRLGFADRCTHFNGAFDNVLLLIRLSQCHDDKMDEKTNEQEGNCEYVCGELFVPLLSSLWLRCNSVNCSIWQFLLRGRG